MTKNIIFVKYDIFMKTCHFFVGGVSSCCLSVPLAVPVGRDWGLASRALSPLAWGFDGQGKAQPEAPAGNFPGAARGIKGRQA